VNRGTEGERRRREHTNITKDAFVWATSAKSTMKHQGVGETQGSRGTGRVYGRGRNTKGRTIGENWDKRADRKEDEKEAGVPTKLRRMKKVSAQNRERVPDSDPIIEE